MAIYKGSQKDTGLHKGATRNQKMYKGNTLVYQYGSQYQKYNSTPNYSWKQYNANANFTTKTQRLSGEYVLTGDKLSNISYSTSTTSSGFNLSSSQVYLGSSTTAYGADSFFNAGSSTTVYAKIYKATYSYTANGMRSYFTDELSKEANGYERGTYRKLVYSTNSAAYPTNGRHTDGYWYDTRTIDSYIRGSFISTLEAPPGTYPTNGRHTDGYWYVLI